MTESPLVRFYSGSATDGRRRSLDDLLALDDARMEFYHDFIQWLFPTRRPSDHQDGAPVLTDDDVAAFLARPELRAALRRSYDRFLRFLGLEEVGGVVREVEGLGPRRRVFAVPNHNWLRITRVLDCLHTLGLSEECRAFFDYLERVYERGDGVTADTFAYWRSAAEGSPLP